MPSLAEIYCAHHRVAPDGFARHALVRALTLQAQVLYPALRLIPGFFDPDLEFIRTAGRATHLRDFATDAADFKLHPDNTGTLRRVLRFRVSSRKLRRVLASPLVAHAPTAATASAVARSNL